MEGLVGRETELREVEAFLDRVAHGPGGLVIEGPPGIGKSALWAAALEQARASGRRVLAARPTGAEVTYAYQSLADLLGEHMADVGAILPGPQRRALEVALLRADAPNAEAGVDPRAVAVAATGALALLARDAPLLVAVDDAGWLDAASVSVLAFAVRRLGDRPIGVLVTQRAEPGSDVALDLEAAIPTARLWLGPLSLGALHALLAERVGLTLPRPTLLRLARVSDGNPFHALEIGRALRRLPRLPRPGEPLPIPASVRGLVAGRLAGVSASTRRLLLLGAVGRTDLGELGAIVGREAAEEAFREAADAGLVVLDGGELRFAHPLIASTVEDEAKAAERRAAHADLARVARTAEARGRHIALARVGPDAAVADALDEAAEDARHRGATEVAAELRRLALERTPTDLAAARGERLVRLAATLIDLSDLAGADAVLQEALGALPHGRLRAEALVEAATVAWYAASSPEAVGHLTAALAETDDVELRGRIHYRLAVFRDYDVAGCLGDARAAVELLARVDAPATYAAALSQLFHVETLSGLPPRTELIERALEVEPPGSHPDKSTIPGIWWLAIDRPDLARARFADLLEADRAAGQASAEADLLTRLAETECYADRWRAARSFADEATEVARQAGQTSDPAVRARALIDAHEGRLDGARATCAGAAARAVTAGDHIIAAAYLQVLALVAASAGEPAEVVRVSDASRAALGAIGIREPLRLDTTPERIEALVALGRLDEATEELAGLDARGRTVPRPWVDAALARGRALLHAALGELEEAVSATAPATDDRSAGWRSFDRARSLLVRGRVLRQARARADAGRALDAALATFEELGAAGWAAAARAELDRLGRHRPGTAALTPSERLVAELVGGGLRTREVAERLAISPKTVEAHLGRIYAKLGIGTRAELGRLAAEGALAPEGTVPVGEVGEPPM